LARTAAVNALVMGEVFYLINCRSLIASSGNLSSFIGSRPALVTIAAVSVLQATFTYAAPFQRMFGTAAIDAESWGRILLFGILLFAAVESEKALLRYRARH
jgi:magnesium-transporting ATPase (P-type)